MSPGYSSPLYLLPFDHRNSYVSGMFHLTPPLTADKYGAVVDSKQVIDEGFQHALGRDVPGSYAGIMVDEECAADLVRDAVMNGYVTALSTEKRGSREYDFDHGDAVERLSEA